MSTIVDVTKLVNFGNSDDESLPITKCVCGKEFNEWEFDISIYDDSPCECPECGAKLYFRNKIIVYQIKEE